MQYIDLTQSFGPKMPVYPGDAYPELTPMEQDGIMDHKLSTGMHVGTHMDAPLHMVPGGKKISELSPEKFFGRGVLVDARGQEKIGPELFVDIQANDIVLLYTGFGVKFNDADYYEKYPELTEAAANKLVELKVKLVGMDTPSPDRPPYLSHKVLLKEEILIIENLTNLEQLIDKKFDVVALPAKLETDAAPTRVIAQIK